MKRLLLFLSLAASLLVGCQSMPSLSKSDTETARSQIELTPKGAFYVDGKAATQGDFIEKLDHKAVTVVAPRDVPFSRVNAILVALEEAGFKDVVMSVTATKAPNE